MGAEMERELSRERILDGLRAVAAKSWLVPRGEQDALAEERQPRENGVPCQGDG